MVSKRGRDRQVASILQAIAVLSAGDPTAMLEEMVAAVKDDWVQMHGKVDKHNSYEPVASW
jgi:hypothetical protein